MLFSKENYNFLKQCFKYDIVIKLLIKLSKTISILPVIAIMISHGLFNSVCSIGTFLLTN